MVLKPSLDTRDGEGVIRSRAGLERKCIMIDKDINLYKAIKAYKNVLDAQFETLKWVLIDECQFLKKHHVLELAESTCECGDRKTSINARFDKNGEIITEGSQVEIGGNEKYRAICRKCWKDKVRDKLLKENEAKT